MAVAEQMSPEARAEAGRADPIDLQEQAVEERVPELVPNRYARMLTSPDQAERDYQALQEAARGGRVPVSASP